jgi:pimeloyl-ACP methyl ester carboxylesterase
MSQIEDRVTGYAPVAGGRLYFEQAGSGHPLVLSHAGLAHSPMWDTQMAAFAAHYRVIRYDLRGFGQSSDADTPFAYYDDLRDLLGYLGIEHAYMLGLSLGSAVTLNFALAYPAMVDALILGAMRLGHEPPSDWLREGWARVDAAEEAGDIPLAVELESQLWVDGPGRTTDQVDPAVREFVRQANTAAFHRAAGAVQPTPLTPPARDRLSEIRVPTLIVAGDSDVPDVLTSAAYTAQHIAGAQTVIIPGAAHMVNMEQPATFNTAVLTFLQSLNPAP